MSDPETRAANLEWIERISSGRSTAEDWKYLAELEAARDLVRGGNCIRDDEGQSPCERLRAALEVAGSALDAVWYSPDGPITADAAHLVDCARASLRSLEGALPPVPVGPDGEAAGPEARSAEGADARGKADA